MYCKWSTLQLLKNSEYSQKNWYVSEIHVWFVPFYPLSSLIQWIVFFYNIFLNISFWNMCWTWSTLLLLKNNEYIKINWYDSETLH